MAVVLAAARLFAALRYGCVTIRGDYEELQCDADVVVHRARNPDGGEER